MAERSEEIGKLWVATFTDDRLANVRHRFRRQAEAMRDAFDGRIVIYSDKDLKPEFVRAMGGAETFRKRGFGFWCWKPWIILETLRKMPDGDVLLYADAGCHLNRKGLKRLEEYRRLAFREGMLAFQARSTEEPRLGDYSGHYFLERIWSKGDLLDYFNVRDRSDIVESGQLMAQVMLLKKTESTLEFVTTWLNMFLNHLSLCDDTPSVSDSLSGFRSNRYDQSVFSLLGKLAGIRTLSIGECVPISSFMPEGGNARYWNDSWWRLRHNPVLAMHDKGGFLFRLPLWLRALIRHAMIHLLGRHC